MECFAGCSLRCEQLSQNCSEKGNPRLFRLPLALFQSLWAVCVFVAPKPFRLSGCSITQCKMRLSFVAGAWQIEDHISLRFAYEWLWVFVDTGLLSLFACVCMRQVDGKQQKQRKEKKRNNETRTNISWSAPNSNYAGIDPR